MDILKQVYRNISGYKDNYCCNSKKLKTELPQLETYF